MEQLDERVTLWLNLHYCDFSDFVWKMFSDIGIWIPMYLAVAVMLFVRLGWKRAAVALVSIALTIVACDQMGNVVKEAVGRLRPSHNVFMLDNGLHLLESAGGKYGFYSAHAANAVGFALTATLFFKWDRTRSYNLLGSLLGIWSALVGISRIFVGKHFLGDVLAGSLAGIIIGLIFYNSGRFIWKHCIQNSSAADTK